MSSSDSFHTKYICISFPENLILYSDLVTPIRFTVCPERERMVNSTAMVWGRRPPSQHRRLGRGGQEVSGTKSQGPRTMWVTLGDLGKPVGDQNRTRRLSACQTGPEEAAATSPQGKQGREHQTGKVSGQVPLTVAGTPCFPPWALPTFRPDHTVKNQKDSKNYPWTQNTVGLRVIGSFWVPLAFFWAQEYHASLGSQPLTTVVAITVTTI